MNRVTSSHIANELRKYEKDRRNSNVKYSDQYMDVSLLTQYYQAAYIRILLFSRLTGQKFRIGNYRVALEKVIFSLKFPSLHVDGKRVKWIKVSILQEEWGKWPEGIKINVRQCLENILVRQFSPENEENFRVRVRVENRRLLPLYKRKLICFL